MENQIELSSNLKKVLEDLDYNIEKVLRTTAKNSVLLVEKAGAKKILKIAVDQNFSDNLINEVNANEFINRLKPVDLPLIIPTSKLVKTGQMTIAEFAFIAGESLATQETVTINQIPEDALLEKLYQIQKFYYSIKLFDVPEYFIEKADRQFTQEQYEAKMEEYLARPIGKLINEEEKKKLLKNMQAIGYRRAFQQHDFVLWNMFNVGDKVAIVDSEYSRWGMRWYDIAYFFIQMYVYFKNPELAKKCLKFFINRFKEDFPNSDIEREILFPMNYRITANLNESLDDPVLGKLARELLEKILTNDINKILE
jgi:hypothetical protein